MNDDVFTEIIRKCDLDTLINLSHTTKHLQSLVYAIVDRNLPQFVAIIDIRSYDLDKWNLRIVRRLLILCRCINTCRTGNLNTYKIVYKNAPPHIIEPVLRAHKDAFKTMQLHAEFDTKYPNFRSELAKKFLTIMLPVITIECLNAAIDISPEWCDENLEFGNEHPNYTIQPQLMLQIAIRCDLSLLPRKFNAFYEWASHVIALHTCTCDKAFGYVCYFHKLRSCDYPDDFHYAEEMAKYLPQLLRYKSNNPYYFKFRQRAVHLEQSIKYIIANVNQNRAINLTLV